MPLISTFGLLEKEADGTQPPSFFFLLVNLRFLPPSLYPWLHSWRDLMKKPCKSTEKYINLLCNDKLQRVRGIQSTRLKKQNKIKIQPKKTLTRTKLKPVVLKPCLHYPSVNTSTHWITQTLLSYCHLKVSSLYCYL